MNGKIRQLAMWVRRKIPALVELDAFREIRDLEERLERTPGFGRDPAAVPALLSAVDACRLTRQNARQVAFMRLLRDIPPPEVPDREKDGAGRLMDADAKVERLYPQAVAFLRSCERVSWEDLSKRFKLAGYPSMLLYNALAERGAIDSSGRVNRAKVAPKPRGRKAAETQLDLALGA